MGVLEKFVQIFTGSDVAYGDWVQDRDPKAYTRHGKVTEKHYEDHIKGVVGLGVIPVNSQGLSVFGAIDIDIDTIDHKLLQETVTKSGLPLHVCRSKSGGAHLYIFARAPGIPASQLRQMLGMYAAALGYPNAEIFPKQNRSSEDNVGNWINLPYMGGDSSFAFYLPLRYGQEYRVALT